jgi:hypothetical protein
MARIRTSGRSGWIHVKVTGRLGTGDLRRLEHACAPALVSSPAALDLDLTGVTISDPSADLIVAGIARRGARIRRAAANAQGG